MVRKPIGLATLIGLTPWACRPGPPPEIKGTTPLACRKGSRPRSRSTGGNLVSHPELVAPFSFVVAPA